MFTFYERIEMEKIIQFTLVVIILIIMFSCTKNEENPFGFIENNKEVIDSLVSLKIKYEEDFFIFDIKEDNDYIALTFILPSGSYSLYNKYNYKYRQINGVDLLYIENYSSKNNKDYSDIKKLINNGSVVISDKQYQTNYWYTKFIYCKNHPENIVIYDKISFENEYEKGIRKGSYNTFLYPECY